MRVNYLGPALLGLDHPALEGGDVGRLSSSCYLVEVSDEAGIDGEIIEGDVLVIDEVRSVQHGDLVVVQLEDQLRLCRSHRIGNRFRLLSTVGPQVSGFSSLSCCRGVVVNYFRQSNELEVISSLGKGV